MAEDVVGDALEALQKEVAEAEEAAVKQQPKPQQQPQNQQKQGQQRQQPQNQGSGRQQQPAQRQQAQPQQQPQQRGGYNGGQQQGGQGQQQWASRAGNNFDSLSLFNYESKRTALIGAYVGLGLFLGLWVLSALATKTALENVGFREGLNKVFKTTDWTTAYPKDAAGINVAYFLSQWGWVPLCALITTFEMSFRPPKLFFLGRAYDKDARKVKLKFEWYGQRFAQVVMSNKLIMFFWFAISGMGLLSNVAGVVDWFGNKTWPLPAMWTVTEGVGKFATQHVEWRIGLQTAASDPIFLLFCLFIAYVMELEAEPNIRKCWFRIQNLRKGRL